MIMILTLTQLIAINMLCGVPSSLVSRSRCMSLDQTFWLIYRQRMLIFISMQLSLAALRELDSCIRSE